MVIFHSYVSLPEGTTYAITCVYVYIYIYIYYLSHHVSLYYTLPPSQKPYNTSTSGSSQRPCFAKPVNFQQNRPWPAGHGLLDIDVIGQGQGVRALLGDLRNGMAMGPLGSPGVPWCHLGGQLASNHEVLNIKSHQKVQEIWVSASKMGGWTWLTIQNRAF